MFLSSDFIVFIKNSVSLIQSLRSALSSVVSKFISKAAKRKEFSRWRGCPDSLLVMVEPLGAAGTLVPGHTAFCGMSQPSFLKDESILHGERKGPMNVIFYLSWSVDTEIFVFDTHL